MPDESNDPLLAALHGLPREVAPPRDLEGATVNAVYRAGLLRRRPAFVPWLMAASLAIVAFTSGMFTARRAPASPPSPTFALMLYGGSTEGDSAAHAIRAAEYGAWAGKAHNDGFVVGGEALGAGGSMVSSPAGALAESEGDAPVGFFLVRAPDAGAATRMARDCPHLKYGGRIVVRPILPT